MADSLRAVFGSTERRGTWTVPADRIKADMMAAIVDRAFLHPLREGLATLAALAFGLEYAVGGTGTASGGTVAHRRSIRSRARAPASAGRPPTR